MEKSFWKYSGCGNDFVIFEDHDRELTLSPEQIQFICHRTNGIGADGIILLQPSEVADFKMVIFNADGSEAEMCGNGLRCIVDFACRYRSLSPRCKVETKAAVLTAKWSSECVETEMPCPSGFQASMMKTSIAGQVYDFNFINTGVPHAVAFSSDIQDCNMAEIGPLVRYASAFSPSGTNVSIAEFKEDILTIRTYERGVEAETESCGTAATAAALLSGFLRRSTSPVTVRTKNGCQLVIDFNIVNKRVIAVSQSGPAALTYKGIISICLNSEI